MNYVCDMERDINAIHSFIMPPGRQPLFGPIGLDDVDRVRLLYPRPYGLVHGVPLERPRFLGRLKLSSEIFIQVGVLDRQQSFKVGPQGRIGGERSSVRLCPVPDDEVKFQPAPLFRVIQKALDLGRLDVVGLLQRRCRLLCRGGIGIATTGRCRRVGRVGGIRGIRGIRGTKPGPAGSNAPTTDVAECSEHRSALEGCQSL